MTGQIVYAGYGVLAGRVVRDFAVYVENDRIATVGSLLELTTKYPDTPRVGGDHLIMLPGFINAHDHGRAIGTQSLGLTDSFLEVWLHSLGSLPSLPPYLAAAWEGLQLIKSGVTSTAHSHNPHTWETQFDEIPPTLRGYVDAGVRVAMHPVIVDQNRLVYFGSGAFIDSLPEHLRVEAGGQLGPPPLSNDDYFVELTRLYDTYHDTNTHRVHIQASPAGGQWCSDDLILRAVEWARERDTHVQMHMLETQYQRIYAYKQWGQSFIQHLDRIGALGHWLTLAHMIWVEDEDIPLLAERAVGVAHNPSSNLRLRSGIAPVAQMLYQGVTVGIGMDGQTLDDDQDYLREMRLAWTLANRPNMLSRYVSATQCLLAGTQQSAQITFGDTLKIGQLATDALADLCLNDWNQMAGLWYPDDWLEIDQILPFLLRRASANHIRHVMVGGEWQLRDGVHTQLDEQELAREMRDHLSSIASSDTTGGVPADHFEEFYRQWKIPGRLQR